MMRFEQLRGGLAFPVAMVLADCSKLNFRVDAVSGADSRYASEPGPVTYNFITAPPPNERTLRWH